MKNIIYILSFLLVSVGYAQETTNNRNNENQRDNRNNNTERPNFYEVMDTTEYEMNKEEYLFIKDDRGLKVYRNVADGQIDVGNLRRTTMDGYYIMTTTPENKSSFGRFDEEGNFQSFRYDPATDAVIEEVYINRNPQRTNRNRGNKRDGNRRNNNN